MSFWQAAGRLLGSVVTSIAPSSSSSQPTAPAASPLTTFAADLIGIPATEIQTIAAALGAIPPAIAELRSGDKVKITDGVFALAIAAETVVVMFDPALAPVLSGTRVGRILAELAVKYGKPIDITDPNYNAPAGPVGAEENPGTG